MGRGERLQLRKCQKKKSVDMCSSLPAPIHHGLSNQPLSWYTNLITSLPCLNRQNFLDQSYIRIPPLLDNQIICGLPAQHRVQPHQLLMGFLGLHCSTGFNLQLSKSLLWMAIFCLLFLLYFIML